jgi:3-oxoacyl-[acyl-carrier-protein] synthase II
VRAEEVDYLNAHGTSTPMNDRSECVAVRAVFGAHADAIAVSSTKSQMGHLIASAGAVEAAICALAIRDGWAPASVNLFEPDPDVAALLPGLLRAGRDGRYRRVLSTSFGFGGLNASLVFGAVEG